MVAILKDNDERALKARNMSFTLSNGIRIYLLSNCMLYHAGLEHICESEEGFDLIGSENSVPDTLDTFVEAHPDLIILDQSLLNNNDAPDASATLHLFHDISHIVILAEQLDLPFACSAIAYGAEGYLLTSSSVDEMLQALRVVALGGMWLEPPIAHALTHQALTMNSPDIDRHSRLLSEREQQILHGVATGQTSKEIAGQLYLSESSVRTYWYRVLTKLNAINKAEALVIAGQMGLLDYLHPKR